MRILRVFTLAGLVSAAALCQEAPAAAPLAFEVATIKPSEPIGGMGGKIAIRIGVRNDGAMVTYTGMTLKALVQNAYAVKDYQVTGAPWMDEQRFDISAKLPDGATKDQAPEMLQNLLKERFKVAIHREKKDHPIYALVAGKGGLKLKPAEVSADAPGAPASGDPGRAPAPPPPSGGPSQTAMAAPGPGAPGPGGRGPMPPGAMSMRMGPNGGHVEAKAMTVARFAETISRFLDRPVIDQTGIEGNYDFAIDLSQEEMGGMMAQMKGAMMMAGAPMGGGGGAGGAMAGGPAHAGPDGPPNAPEGGSLFQSIQSYGLKLEPKKAAMEMIAIDTAEKTPTEN
jgi:uncharacterized protein (TIGR03435 family)